MAIQGLRTTADFLVDGQRPKNWREGIMKLYPNGGATLTALTAMMKERKVDDPEYNWYERELTSRRFQLGANVANTAAQTLLTFDGVRDVKELKAGDMLWAEESGEIVKVAVDPVNTTQVLVDRGFAGSTTAAIIYNGAGVNPNFVVMGSAYEEASLPPTGVALDPVKRNNYTQIFRQTLEMSRTAQKTRLRTGDQVKQAKADTLELLSMDMERAFLFGKKSEATQNGKPIRTTDGIITRITADAPGNIITASATTDMDDMESYFQTIFAYGSDEKIALVGNQALGVLNALVRKNSAYTISGVVKEYGMNVQRFVSPFGELALKRYTLFNNLGGGTTGGAAYYGPSSWALILDAKELTYTYFDDIEYEQKLEANGLDGMKSGYIGECSIEVHNSKTHALIKALKAGVADAP